MPAGTRAQLGNLLFEQALYFPALVPPGTITTAVVTPQNVTVIGVLPGDLVSWNLIAPTDVKLSIANMYVSAANTLVIGWSTEGATISGAAAQQILLSVARPENASLGLTALPANVV
jgi:hypothetical protein